MTLECRGCGRPPLKGRDLCRMCSGGMLWGYKGARLCKRCLVALGNHNTTGFCTNCVNRCRCEACQELFAGKKHRLCLTCYRGVEEFNRAMDSMGRHTHPPEDLAERIKKHTERISREMPPDERS